jgi:LPS sulfotransferase NodH
VADPQAAADAIADLLGLDTRPRVDMAKVSFEVQRDTLTDEWRERFVREAGDLTYLDDRLWRLRPRLLRWRSLLR